MEFVDIEERIISGQRTLGCTQSQPNVGAMHLPLFYGIAAFSYATAAAAGAVGEHMAAGPEHIDVIDFGDLLDAVTMYSKIDVGETAAVKHYAKAGDAARTLLDANWPAVAELAALLLVQGRVEGADVHRIVLEHRTRTRDDA